MKLKHVFCSNSEILKMKCVSYGRTAMGLKKDFGQSAEKLDSLNSLKHYMTTSIGDQKALPNITAIMGTGLKNNVDVFPKTENKAPKNEEIIKLRKDNLEITRNENMRDLVNLEKIEILRTAANLKCHECKDVLSKDLPLRKDGVSVVCENCHIMNIIGCLKEGHKWMHGRSPSTFCDLCSHFKQFPIDAKEGERYICELCALKNKFWNANSLMAVPC